MLISEYLGFSPSVSHSTLSKQFGRVVENEKIRHGDSDIAFQIPSNLKQIGEGLERMQNRGSRDSYKQRAARLRSMRNYTDDEQFKALIDSTVRQLESGAEVRSNKKGRASVDSTQMVADLMCERSSMVTQLQYSVYDEALIATFKNNGAVCKYTGVPPGVYAQLELAELKSASVGKAFWDLVRGRFGGKYSHEGGIFPFTYVTGGESMAQEPKEPAEVDVDKMSVQDLRSSVNKVFKQTAGRDMTDAEWKNMAAKGKASLLEGLSLEEGATKEGIESEIRSGKSNRFKQYRQGRKRFTDYLSGQNRLEYRSV